MEHQKRYLTIYSLLLPWRVSHCHVNWVDTALVTVLLGISGQTWQRVVILMKFTKVYITVLVAGGLSKKKMLHYIAFFCPGEFLTALLVRIFLLPVPWWLPCCYASVTYAANLKRWSLVSIIMSPGNFPVALLAGKYYNMCHPGRGFPVSLAFPFPSFSSLFSPFFLFSPFPFLFYLTAYTVLPWCSLLPC